MQFFLPKTAQSTITHSWTPPKLLHMQLISLLHFFLFVYWHSLKTGEFVGFLVVGNFVGFLVVGELVDVAERLNFGAAKAGTPIVAHIALVATFPDALEPLNIKILKVIQISNA